MSLDYNQFSIFKNVIVTPRPNKFLEAAITPSYLTMLLNGQGRLGIVGRSKALAEHEKRVETKSSGYDQAIGIEIELEGCKYKQEFQDYSIDCGAFWGSKQDGSLRNNGVEFVSHLGLLISSADIALDALKKDLDEHLPKCEANVRTGLHIHFNIQGRSLYTLANILTLYALTEPAWFKISGNRADSIFCVPWFLNRKTLGNVLSNLLTTVQQGNYRYWKWRNYSKYCALNLSTIPIFGTIEFRHHVGTKDPETIMRWIKSLYKLFKLAEETDLITNLLKYRGKRSRAVVFELLNTVFPNHIYDGATREIIEDVQDAMFAFYKGFVDQESLPKLDNSNEFVPDLNRHNFNAMFGLEERFVVVQDELPPNHRAGNQEERF